MTYIAIEWINGRPSNGAEEDEARAVAAAEKVFADAGMGPAECEAEYRDQWAAFDDEEPMYGRARVWIQARNAADIAATENWHNPDGASVTINAA